MDRLFWAVLIWLTLPFIAENGPVVCFLFFAASKVVFMIFLSIAFMSIFLFSASISRVGVLLADTVTFPDFSISTNKATIDICTQLFGFKLFRLLLL